jgi:hypothetical protein
MKIMCKPLFLLATILCFKAIISCSVNSITYNLVRGPRIPSTVPQFNISDIKAHLDEEGLSIYASNIKSTYSCVDGRKDDPILASPGGDWGEFILGLETYFSNRRDLVVTQPLVQSILHRYISEVATTTRPFYYHTAKHYVDLLLESLEIFPKPVIFPESEPTNSDLWYAAFLQYPHQGCGHVRYMVKNQTSFGIMTPNLPQMVLESYLRIWWSGDSSITSKMTFDILQGGLDSGAIAVVTNEGPGCLDHSPLVAPNELGNSVFVYHPHAVNDFRHQVVIPFFKRYDKTIDSGKFWGDMSLLAQIQLEVVLTVLAPANQVNTFTVKVFTDGEPTEIIGNYHLSVLVIALIVIFVLGLGAAIFVGYFTYWCGKKHAEDHNFNLFMMMERSNLPMERTEKSVPVMQTLSNVVTEDVESDEHVQINFSPVNADPE